MTASVRLRPVDTLTVPTYAKACASCHGADMKGNQALVRAQPDRQGVALRYGERFVDIERTILYGIRSG